MSIEMHGREKEFAVLLEVHARIVKGFATCGEPEIVLVTAPSGVGKSFFINSSMEKILASQEGYFVSGKCNKIQRHQPFSCIVSALNMLCESIRKKKERNDSDSDGDSDSERIKASFLELNSEEGRILTDLIPKLEDIIGRQNQHVYELSSKERQIRLNRVFRCFFRAVTVCSPLVLFLDDLQWVDDASLELVRSLITDGKLKRFMLLCSHRDIASDSKRRPEQSIVPQSQNDEDRLNRYFCQLSDNDLIKVTRIVMPSLSLNTTIHIVASDLSLSQNEVSLLASFIYDYTKGNAMFTVRFLKYLREKNFICISPDDSQLKWELDKIRNSTDIPNTLQGILIDELTRVTCETRDLLTRAAMLGFYFDTFTMQIATSQKIQIDDSFAKVPSFQVDLVTKTSLKESEELGFIEKIGSVGHQFCHDQLWSIAYEALQEETRNRLHLQIGRALVKIASPSSNKKSSTSKSNKKKCLGLTEDDMNSFLDRQLFVAVSQFNKGKHLIDDPIEKKYLISLNLQAAKFAMKWSAWMAAIEYANIGIKLFEKNHWNDQYNLSLQLHNVMIEAYSSIGDFETLKGYIKDVTKHGTSSNDTFDANYAMIISLLMQKKTANAIALGNSVLGQLGVSLKSNPAAEDASMSLLRLRFMLRNQTFESIVKLPLMKEPFKKISKLAFALITASYGTPFNLVMVKKLVELTLKNGIDKHSSVSLVGAFVYLPKKKRFLLDAAVHLEEKFKFEITNNWSTQVLHGFCYHLVAPIRLSLNELWQGITIATNFGDVLTASTLGSLSCSYYYLAGISLDIVEDKLNSFFEWIEEYKQVGNLRSNCLPYLQAVKCLKGETASPSVLNGDQMNLQEFILEAQGSIMLNCTLAICRLELCYIFQDYKEAGRILTSMPDILDARPGHFSGTRFKFYECLISIELARSTGNKSWRTRAKVTAKKIRNMVKDGNVNCKHMVPFIEAEFAWLQGYTNQARAAYIKITQDVDNESFIQDRALLFERAGMYFRSLGENEMAIRYLSQSCNLYAEWGAKAKTDLMLLQVST